MKRNHLLLLVLLLFYMLSACKPLVGLGFSLEEVVTNLNRSLGTKFHMKKAPEPLYGYNLFLSQGPTLPRLESHGKAKNPASFTLIVSLRPKMDLQAMAVFLSLLIPEWKDGLAWLKSASNKLAQAEEDEKSTKIEPVKNRVVVLRIAKKENVISLNILSLFWWDYLQSRKAK